MTSTKYMSLAVKFTGKYLTSYGSTADKNSSGNQSFGMRIRVYEYLGRFRIPYA